MIVRFTKLGSAAFWQMICNPSGAQFKTDDWYRPDSPTEEVEVAKLHKFADTQLCATKKVTVKDQSTGHDREVEEKEFNEGVFSLRKDLKIRAEKIIDHYRDKSKKGKGRLLAIHFAELEAGINNKDMPTDAANMDVADPEDAAELKKARAALAEESKALPTPEPAAKD